MKKYSELKTSSFLVLLHMFCAAIVIFTDEYKNVIYLFAMYGVMVTGLLLFIGRFLSLEYRCTPDGVSRYIGKFLREQIPYKEIQLMVISNSTAVGRVVCKNGERRKINGKKVFVQYAHVTFFKEIELIGEMDLQPGAESWHLITPYNQRNPLHPTEALFEGICWSDYLESLLEHMQTTPIYILEDVYERFKPDYDRIFSRAKNPIYIVTAPHTCRQYLRKSVI